jgi:hypothetical protein
MPILRRIKLEMENNYNFKKNFWSCYKVCKVFISFDSSSAARARTRVCLVLWYYEIMKKNSFKSCVSFSRVNLLKNNDPRFKKLKIFRFTEVQKLVK